MTANVNEPTNANPTEQNLPSPEDMVMTQQFAEKSLELITQEAASKGMDPGLLHSAFCVASIGFLANVYGPDRTLGFLKQLEHAVEASRTTLKSA